MRLASLNVYRDFIEFFVRDSGVLDVVNYKISEAEVQCTCKKNPCEHADFLYKYFEKMGISEIASLLEKRLKDRAPEVNPLRLSRMMMNVLFNCQISITPTPQSTEKYGWEGTLEDGTRARVIELVPMRSYEVYLLDKISNLNKQTIRVSEGGYTTVCSCPDSMGLRPCGHIDAVTKAIETWSGDDEYKNRILPASEAPANPVQLNNLGAIRVQLSKQLPKLNEIIRDQMKRSAEEIEGYIRANTYATGGVVKGPENNYIVIDDFRYFPSGSPVYVRDSDGKFVTADGQEVSVDFSSGVEKTEEPKEPPKPKTRFDNFEI